MWAFSTNREKANVTSAIDQLRAVDGKQSDVISSIRTLHKYDVEGCDTVKLKNGSIKDADIVDISTMEQRIMGISMFSVKINRTVTSPIHNHVFSAQLVYIKKGMIFDKITRKRLKEGEFLFTDSPNNHSIKYIKGAELVFVYLPNSGLIA